MHFCLIGQRSDCRIYHCTSGHVVGYNIKWEEEYKWLVPDQNEGGVVTGMYCELCIRHKCKNKYNHSAVWNETPCVCVRKDSVRRHSLSVQHKEAVIMQGGEQAKWWYRTGFSELQSKLLWNVVKSEVPHMSLYPSMLEVVKFMWCDQLRHLDHGQNAKYTSHRITEEFREIKLVKSS